MKSRKETDITIIIPALNESEHIAMTLDEINKVLQKEQNSYQIIVVDDASIDATALVAKEHGVDIVIRTEHSVGKGAAIRLGVSKASGSIILTMDADGTYDPNDMTRLVTPILQGEADLVIGSRIVRYHENFLSKLGNMILSSIIGLYLGIKILDIGSGFRAYRASLLHDLLNPSLSSGHLFDSEIAFLAKKRGYRIAEIPVRMRRRESFGYSRRKFLGLQEAFLLYTIVLRLSLKYG